jgi:hypothetical protein
MFDVGGHLDELRSWPTERLVAHRDCLVSEQRRLHVEELDVLRVLDERGRVDTSVGAHGESARTVRDKVEQARALESLPAVAAAAYAGALSDEQLGAVVKLADESTDAEWARRAPNVAPADLERVETPSMAVKPLLVVSVPLVGPTEVAGIPLADAVLEQLRANANIEPVLVDDDGTVLAVGKQTSAISQKILRAVLLRDGHCRIPGCEINYGLHAHHLQPRSWGGTDDLSNLAMVCTAAGHHAMLIPHGPWALVGNPNRPDGLHLVYVDDLNCEQAAQLGLPPPRAKPAA